MLARLLSRQSDDLELALTQMVRAVDGDTEMPALIFRCQLVAESAGKVGGVLRATLQPSRELHGHQVYGLKAPGRRGNGGVGSEIEVVLAGRNLVVSNDPVALKKAVNPHTTAGPVLSKNTRYQSLRKRIEVPKGAVMLYANWRLLGPRLSSMLEIHSGLPFRWSGLGDTDRVLVVVRPAGNRGTGGFVTSVLLGQRPRPFPGRFPGPRGRIPEARGLDGWLSMVDAARPQQLLGGLALGGFTNVAMALDPKKLLPTRRGPRMHSMQRWIFGRATQVGLDIKRQVIRRLDKNCGARVMLLPGDGLTPRVVYSFQARSRRLAQELVQDLQTALIAARPARSRQLESGAVLEIDSPGFGRYSF